MTKNLFIREIHQDYRVKDSKTFAKEHVKRIKELTHAPIDLDGEVTQRRIKVQKISKIEFIQEDDTWLFSCDAKVKLYND
jgi:hypothetical protein